MLRARVAAEASSVVRAPWMIRLKVSRPRWSVPNRCSGDGESNLPGRLISVGSSSGSQGANNPASSRDTTRNSPKAVPGSRNSAFHFRRRREPLAAVVSGRRSLACSESLVISRYTSSRS